jgi:hypothetical protein
MKQLSLPFVLIFLGLFANQASAQISWVAGYPKTGATGGCVSVQGSVALGGWTLQSVKSFTWLDGRDVTTSNLTFLANGQWPTDGKGNWVANDIIAGKSGTTVNVVVTAKLTKTGFPDRILNTKPMTATCK